MLPPHDHDDGEAQDDDKVEVQDDDKLVSPSAASSWFRFLPAGLGDTEDLERYASGGFHPTHLGDVFDGRYRVVHKLGAGGFSTVWLAKDTTEDRYVALKIVVADQSAAIEARNLSPGRAALRSSSQGNSGLVIEQRHFTIDGPNGHHIYLVFPVLGPSTSQLSCYLDSRLTPRLARKAGYQAAQALARLHALGLCHGDMTTANIAFGLSNIDQYTEDDFTRLLGAPETAPLETESGEEPGPEAPRYIVKPLDFLDSKKSIISWDVQLIDFDLPPVPASDVWALGCSIFRLRSGHSPFASLDVWAPRDTVAIIASTLGDLPASWGDVLFNYEGQPTQDPEKGAPLRELVEKRSLRELVDAIYDRPDNGIAMTGTTRREREVWNKNDNIPYPPCVEGMAWKPKSTKIDNIYLYGYNEETDGLLAVMPKITAIEADLLYDLLSKIFVYDTAKRITAEGMLAHPWFHMDQDG
ncbi:kinase-like protein [Staphylotrichum tortipilum]|uniref:Kinase-like protein n=1 Tax=Staphylotrichum tortipilum TaxID=2831512 RepID=A0AAN6MEU2_9PEZI|nr:kinase-like protein [Staphylotrichum longicolle]